MPQLFSQFRIWGYLIGTRSSVDISAEEDSLAENIHRASLHPLDQFRAFQALREKGQSEEEIAAAFFVGVNVVKQRLRLAAVSKKLLDIYADDGMSLDQLMAFTVTNDHARQEQVWEALQRSYGQEPYQIRSMLTERTARASDKRALFVGLGANEQAGGTVMRDLFQQDDGGWLENVGLLDGMVAEKLKAEAETIATEGWKWIEVNVDFRFGHTHHLRELDGTPTDHTAEEQATIEALQAEYAKIEAEYENADELPDEVDARLGEIETALAAFEVVVAPRIANIRTKTIDIDSVGEDQMILDIGPRTISQAVGLLASARTLVWNGPVGAFEIAPFHTGTMTIARVAAQLTNVGALETIAGGGDTIAALNQAGVTQDFTYVSTAGGAFLEWLEGKQLPGVEALRWSSAASA